MEYHFFCRACGASHNEPADARLGHLVLCLDCATRLAFFEDDLGGTVIVRGNSDREPSIAA